MGDLRERVRKLISIWSLNGSEDPGELADDILAIPEIAGAQKRIAELESKLEDAEDDAAGYRRHPDTWA